VTERALDGPCRRNARLVGQEIREVMLVLIVPAIELGEDERWPGYVRFTSNLQASDAKTLRDALQPPMEFGLCHLLQLSEANAAAAGRDHRAAPVDIRDLRQLDPVSA
jgi:hypothetical protein